jgi:6,7-dimethyl-8-ribityllumazine synthase
MRLNLDTGVPVIFGVLAVLTEDQARARAGLVPGKHNHGVEWAQSALQMAALRDHHLVKKTPVPGLPGV